MYADCDDRAEEEHSDLADALINWARSDFLRIKQTIAIIIINRIAAKQPTDITKTVSDMHRRPYVLESYWTSFQLGAPFSPSMNTRSRPSTLKYIFSYALHGVTVKKAVQTC